jgi:hypothetical protein
MVNHDTFLQKVAKFPLDFTINFHRKFRQFPSKIVFQVLKTSISFCITNYMFFLELRIKTTTHI